jgi:hypothetical protein
MNPLVQQAVTSYLAAATTQDHEGKIISPGEMQELQSQLTVPLPDWYVEVLLSYPLAGAHLNYPYPPENGNEGYARLKLATTRDIYSETEKCYPGLAIRELGYACLATDPTGGGDPYFMKVADGDNPAVYLVYHDVSDIGKEIEQEGMVKIADSLAEFFTNIRITGYFNRTANKE